MATVLPMSKAPESSKKFGAFLQAMREKKAMTQRDLKLLTGLGINTISAHENGHNFPALAVRKIYAKALGFPSVLDMDEAWRGSDSGKRRTSRGSPRGDIPVINLAPAGSPRAYNECFSDSGVGFEYIDRTPGLPEGDLFAFVVVGDSMIPEFQEGDYVVCQWATLEELEEGQPVFVRFGNRRSDECTFKRIYRARDGRIELRPDNPRHPLVIVEAEDILRIAAIAEVRRRTRWRAKVRTFDVSHSQLGPED